MKKEREREEESERNYQKSHRKEGNTYRGCMWWMQISYLYKIHGWQMN